MLEDPEVPVNFGSGWTPTLVVEDAEGRKHRRSQARRGPARRSPRLSPLLVPTEEISGLPPAIVVTAESDPLRDQGEAYAKKLMDASVHVSLARFPGVPHEFFGMTEVIDSWRLAVRQAALALTPPSRGSSPR